MNIPESLFIYCCNRCKEPFQSSENHYSQGTGSIWSFDIGGKVEIALTCDKCRNIDADVWESEGGFSTFQRDILTLLNHYKDEE